MSLLGQIAHHFHECLYAVGNYVFPKDIPALHIAAMFGLDGIVVELSERGSCVDITDSCGWTALYKAAVTGHATTVQLLLTWGADISRKGRDQRTALHWAVSSGNETVVDIISKQGLNTGRIHESNMPTLH